MTDVEREKGTAIRELLAKKDYPELLTELGVSEKIMTNPAWEDLLREAVAALSKFDPSSDIMVGSDFIRISKESYGDSDGSYFSVTDKGSICATTYQSSPNDFDYGKTTDVKHIDRLRVYAVGNNVIKSQISNHYYKPHEGYKPLEHTAIDQYSVVSTSFHEDIYDGNGLMMRRGDVSVETTPTTPYRAVRSAELFGQLVYVERNFRLGEDTRGGAIRWSVDGLEAKQVKYDRSAERNYADLAKLYLYESGRDIPMRDDGSGQKGRHGLLCCILDSEGGLEYIRDIFNHDMYQHGICRTSDEYAAKVEAHKSRFGDIVADQERRLTSHRNINPDIKNTIMERVNATYGSTDTIGQK